MKKIQMKPLKYTIEYFKQSGLWIDTKQVDWPLDAEHYTGYVPFDSLIQEYYEDLIAVCIETPFGFPMMYIPGKEIAT